MLEIMRFENGIATVKETTYKKYFIDFDEGAVIPLKFDNGEYTSLVNPDIH